MYLSDPHGVDDPQMLQFDEDTSDAASVQRKQVGDRDTQRPNLKHPPIITIEARSPSAQSSPGPTFHETRRLEVDDWLQPATGAAEESKAATTGWAAPPRLHLRSPTTARRSERLTRTRPSAEQSGLASSQFVDNPDPGVQTHARVPARRTRVNVRQNSGHQIERSGPEIEEGVQVVAKENLQEAMAMLEAKQREIEALQRKIAQAQQSDSGQEQEGINVRAEGHRLTTHEVGGETLQRVSPMCARHLRIRSLLLSCSRLVFRLGVALCTPTKWQGIARHSHAIAWEIL